MNVDSNETLIFKTQWTIEENRRMILNNYHAAFSVNSKLVNTRSVFQNRMQFYLDIKLLAMRKQIIWNTKKKIKIRLSKS